MRAILALGAIVVSTAASAQIGQNPAVSPDNGFFRPTPGNDPSLTHAPQAGVPPQVVVQPRLAGPFPPPAQPIPAQVNVPAAAAVVPSPAERADAETERAQREAEEVARRAAAAPPGINGAFTGLTNERDR